MLHWMCLGLAVLFMLGIFVCEKFLHSELTRPVKGSRSSVERLDQRDKVQFYIFLQFVCMGLTIIFFSLFLWLLPA